MVQKRVEVLNLDPIQGVEPGTYWEPDDFEDLHLVIMWCREGGVIGLEFDICDTRTICLLCGNGTDCCVC